MASQITDLDGLKARILYLRDQKELTSIEKKEKLILNLNGLSLSEMATMMIAMNSVISLYTQAFMDPSLYKRYNQEAIMDLIKVLKTNDMDWMADPILDKYAYTLVQTGIKVESPEFWDAHKNIRKVLLEGIGLKP